MDGPSRADRRSWSESGLELWFPLSAVLEAVWGFKSAIEETQAAVDGPIVMQSKCSVSQMRYAGSECRRREHDYGTIRANTTLTPSYFRRQQPNRKKMRPKKKFKPRNQSS